MAAPYFSPLRRAIAALLQQSMPPNQWLGTLRNMAQRGAPGIRAAELTESGLEGHLAQRAQAGGMLTREDLTGYLDENAPEFDEVLFGGPKQPRVSNVEEGEPREYGYADRDEAIEQLVQDYADSINEDARQAYTERFWDYSDPKWTVIPHHPGNRPPRWFEEGEPSPDQIDMFSHPDYVPPRRLRPGEKEEWYVVDPEREAEDGWFDPQDDWTAEELNAASQGWFPRTDDVDFEDFLKPRSNYTRRYDNYRPGPWPTRADAEAAMARMQEHARDRYSENFKEAMYDAPWYHRIEREVLDEHIQRYLDEYDFPREGEDAAYLVRGPRYTGYALPGGKDYGELVIREGEAGSGNRGYGSHFDTSSQVGENAIAHVRFSERTDAAGKRTLLVEEVQSDIHQSGRERGYQTPDAYNKYVEASQEQNRAEEEARRVLMQTESSRDVLGASTTEVMAALASIGGPEELRVLTALSAANQAFQEASRVYSGVPNAPLKNNIWVELIVKRMIKFAADHGFERLAWVPGTVKNGSIYPLDGPPKGWQFYDNVMPNITNKLIKKDGQRVGRVRIPGLDQPTSTLDQLRSEDLNAHYIDITPGLAKQHEEVAAYAGVDPARARDLREALLIAMAGGGYGALLATIVQAEQRRQGRVGRN